MFLTCVFIKANFPLEGERFDPKRPTTTMKTFQALGLKPQEQEKKDTAIAATETMVPSTKKIKSKHSKKVKRRS